MDIKQRLQRVLQILEDVECVDKLSELERDIVLGELREAYAELKFFAPSASLVPLKQDNKSRETGDEREVKSATTHIIPIVPFSPAEEETAEEETAEEETAEKEPEVEEPEVEVELLFDEEIEDVENDEQEVEAPIAPATPITPTEIEDTKTESSEEELSSLVSHLSPKKGSALLSLYEDEPTPVLGEQFREQPSVADTIACPKGVAENTPVTSLRNAIGVADRFMLIRELFGGDSDAYEVAIDALDKQQSFDDCIIFIAEHYAWSPNSQAAKFVMDLLQRKYN